MLEFMSTRRACGQYLTAVKGKSNSESRAIAKGLTAWTCTGIGIHQERGKDSTDIKVDVDVL
jgi:hypothetical protein